jgi:metallophosphoesterase superfamily enzyme
MEISNLILQHYPEENSTQTVVCGHIHPGVLLQGTGKQSLRLPCFYKTGNQLILPAFGSTTGLFIVKPGSDSEIFAITPSGIAYYSAMEKI